MQLSSDIFTLLSVLLEHTTRRPLLLKLFFFLIFCASLAVAWGQEQQPGLSLEEAIQKAITAHPARKRAEARLAASKARVRTVAADIMPHVDIEGVSKDGPGGAPSFGFRGLANTPFNKHTTTDITLSQIILDFGRTWHKTASRRFESLAVSFELDDQIALLTLDVGEAYYQVLLQQKLLQVAEETRREREAVAKQAQTMFEAGLRSRVDADLARARLMEAESDLASARNAVEIAFGELNRAMGVPETQHYRLEEHPSAEAEGDLQAPLESQIAKALKSRPAMQAMAYQLKAAKERVAYAKSGHLPTLKAIGSVGNANPGPLLEGKNHTWAVGVGLTIPVYTGGQVEGEVEEARQELREMEASQEDLSQAICLQVMRARLQYDTLKEKLRAATEEVKQADDSLKLASERYRLGLGSFPELVQAEVAALSARTRLERFRYERATAHMALKYAMGE